MQHCDDGFRAAFDLIDKIWQHRIKGGLPKLLYVRTGDKGSSRGIDGYHINRGICVCLCHCLLETGTQCL